MSLPTSADRVEDVPLFPDIPAVYSVNVQRFEGGVWVTAPELMGTELSTETALLARFGGGTYLCIGRDQDQRIVSKRALVLTGPSKPLLVK